MIEWITKFEVILTICVLSIAFGLHRFVIWTTARLSKDLNRSQHRRQYINRYVGYILYTLAVITIVLIWGISEDGLWAALASTFAVIGVALFANWSILSNLTSSFILYFAFPYKIGDRIRVHDKDLPVTAIIIDIKGFYTFLRTDEGEDITYPNNLLLQKGVSILNDRKESVFDMTDQETDKTAR
jgi:small-conductance mechanosensitive channel